MCQYCKFLISNYKDYGVVVTLNRNYGFQNIYRSTGKRSSQIGVGGGAGSTKTGRNGSQCSSYLTWIRVLQVKEHYLTYCWHNEHIKIPLISFTQEHRKVVSENIKMYIYMYTWYIYIEIDWIGIILLKDKSRNKIQAINRVRNRIGINRRRYCVIFVVNDIWG